MSKWIDFSLDERKAMIQGVVEARQIDEAAAEKDWWVTAVLYALFHTSVSEYLLFKGGTSLSKGWDIVEHRRKFYHVGYVDYDKELPANIQIVPSDELMSAYEADYNEMKESFIYGQSLTFADMMKRIGALQEIFRVHKSDNV